ncbi:MAG: Hpt domain-containing protein, partial [Burkholderiaceae bacterium]|nr:Hpt domain-containing protein [Burkholderiaceae bacterium]
AQATSGNTGNGDLAEGADAEASGPVLLDLPRLEGFRHIGMLEELVNDYLPEIARLVSRLEGSVARQDIDESLESLHSLLGMSGEAGASAIYQLVRRVYVPMVEGRHWPVDAEWLVQLKGLSVATADALRAHGTAVPKSSSL